ncbi:MAG: hypothetical protein KIT84_08890 [Labilithrix sp.]|nr:hypothetical protein [Labilithrix sp.]MCW5811115.1 hypothetical protein [Labilithrix sp.]
MKVSHIAFASLALVAVACAPSTSEDIDTGAGAASEEVVAAKSITVGGITLKTEHASAKVKAQNPPEEWNPEFDSCETNVDYFVISGTQHDAEINKALRGEWQLPTAASCEYAETYDAGVTLHILDPEQGILSLTEGESFYGGGAHPNHGMEFKVIDLESGKLLTLADYVKDDATPKLQDLVNKEIETSLTRVYFDSPRFDQSGRKRTYEVKPLDAEGQEMMKNFADYYFTTWEDDAKRPSKPSELRDFLVAGTGIRIDLSNQLPHAFGGMEASYKLTWGDLERAGALRTDTDLIARTKAARPRQPR